MTQSGPELPEIAALQTGLFAHSVDPKSLL